MLYNHNSETKLLKSKLNFHTFIQINYSVISALLWLLTEPIQKDTLLVNKTIINSIQ